MTEGPCSTTALVALLPADFVREVLAGGLSPEAVVSAAVNHVAAAVAAPSESAKRLRAQLDAVRRCLAKDVSLVRRLAAEAARSSSSVTVAHWTTAIRYCPKEETGRAAALHICRAAALAAAGEHAAAQADAREAVIQSPLYAKAWATYAAEASLATTSKTQLPMAAPSGSVADDWGEEWVAPEQSVLCAVAQRLGGSDIDSEGGCSAEEVAIGIAEAWRMEVCRLRTAGRSVASLSTQQLLGVDASGDGRERGGAQLYRKAPTSITNPSAGRCLQAAAVVNAGASVLTELPLAAARRREDDAAKLAAAAVKSTAAADDEATHTGGTELFAAAITAATQPRVCDWCYRPCPAPLTCIGSAGGGAQGASSTGGENGGCADAIYCSHGCRAVAWEAEHRYECRCALPLLLPAETTLARRLHRLCQSEANADADDDDDDVTDLTADNLNNATTVGDSVAGSASSRGASFASDAMSDDSESRDEMGSVASSVERGRGQRQQQTLQRRTVTKVVASLQGHAELLEPAKVLHHAIQAAAAAVLGAVEAWALSECDPSHDGAMDDGRLDNQREAVDMEARSLFSLLCAIGCNAHAITAIVAPPRPLPQPPSQPAAATDDSEPQPQPEPASATSSSSSSSSSSVPTPLKEVVATFEVTLAAATKAAAAADASTAAAAAAAATAAAGGSSGSTSSAAVTVEPVREVRRAVALYPTACLANHSCAPTARLGCFTPGSRALSLVTAKAFRPGEEITISYGPTAERASVGARRAALKEQYCFDCECGACTAELHARGQSRLLSSHNSSGKSQRQSQRQSQSGSSSGNTSNRTGDKPDARSADAKVAPAPTPAPPLPTAQDDRSQEDEDVAGQGGTQAKQGTAATTQPAPQLSAAEAVAAAAEDAKWAMWELSLDNDLDSALELMGDGTDKQATRAAAEVLEASVSRHWSGAYPGDDDDDGGAGGSHGVDEEGAGADSNAAGAPMLALRRQKLANAYDALARCRCSLGEYTRAAPACAEATALLRLCVTPGGEIAMAREEHKLATLRFHAAVQHGPGPGGQEAVGLAAAQVQRALNSVRDTLGLADPATLELAQMAAALLKTPATAAAAADGAASELAAGGGAKGAAAPSSRPAAKKGGSRKKKKPAAAAAAQEQPPSPKKDSQASSSGGSEKKSAGLKGGFLGSGPSAPAPSTATNSLNNPPTTSAEAATEPAGETGRGSGGKAGGSSGGTAPTKQQQEEADVRARATARQQQKEKAAAKEAAKEAKQQAVAAAVAAAVEAKSKAAQAPSGEDTTANTTAAVDDEASELALLMNDVSSDSIADSVSEMRQDRLGGGGADEALSQAAEAKVIRLVALLRKSQDADARLATATALKKLLTAGDSEVAAAATRAFIENDGAIAIHGRLSSMEGNWMQEARNGTVDVYETIARLPQVRPEFSKAAVMDEKAIKAHIAANSDCACIDCDPVTGKPNHPHKKQPGLSGMSNFGEVIAQNSARQRGGGTGGGPSTVSVAAAAALSGAGKRGGKRIPPPSGPPPPD